MKLKGISMIEQHVEKIVLAVMVLVLLGVLSMQFLYQPNMIEIGGRKVPPQAVLGELRKDVDRLKFDLEDPNPSLPEVATPNLLERYQQATSRGSAVPGELGVAFGPAPRIGGNVDIGPISDGPIMAMTVPAPINVLANSQWVAVDPYALEDNPDLRAYVPDEQPYDIVGVSVAGKIDGKALQDLLRSGDGTHRPINSSWIRSGVAVLEVQAERQKFDPVSGSWSAPEAVERFPGAFDLMKDVKGDVTPTGLRDLVAQAEKAVEAIVRPEYVPAIAGPEWLEPEKARERDEQLVNMSDVDLLRHLRRRTLQRIEQNRKRLEETPGSGGTSGARSPDLIPPSATPQKGGGPGIINPGGGRGSQPDQRQLERQRQNEERRRAQIQKTIDDLQKEVERIEQELADRGFPVAGTETTDVSQPDQAEAEPGYLLGNENYRIWVHDLNVEPGAVYRYRLRVKVNNPIFGKERLLDAAAGDDLGLAKQPFAYSDWSAWSDDVIVGKDTYIFLTNGNESKSVRGDVLSTVGSTSAKVSAEVYHMYYGHYRRGTATLTPGDSVHTEVRVPDKLYLFDTEVVSREDAYRLAGIVPKDRRPGFANFPPSTPMQGPSGRMPGQSDPAGRDPFLVPSEFVPPPGAGRPGVPPQTPPEEDAPLPEGVTEAPNRIAVSSGAVLLDVVELPVEVPGGAVRGRPMVYAYFMDENGEVAYRRVDVDTQSREYELVRASYRAGEPDEEDAQTTP